MSVSKFFAEDEAWRLFRQWQSIKPGTRLRNTVNPHGKLAIVSERKADDTGWWCEGGGGLWDRVLLSGEWEVIGYTPSAADGRRFDGPPR